MKQIDFHSFLDAAENKSSHVTLGKLGRDGWAFDTVIVTVSYV